MCALRLVLISSSPLSTRDGESLHCLECFILYDILVCVCVCVCVCVRACVCVWK